jgi:hypothetical protein
MTGIQAHTAARGGAVVLLACGAASVVAAAVLAALATLVLEAASPATRSLAMFRVAAAALFLAGSFLRLARRRVTGLPGCAYLSASMAALAVVALPTDAILPPLLQSALHAAGSLLALGLALRALGLATDPVRTPVRVTVLGWIAVGVAGPAVLILLLPHFHGGTTARTGLLLSLGLTCAWFGVGLHATRRDGTQPWAGRVAPLFGCLGVVELLLSLDHVEPGTWQLPAAALLASVAMVSAHCAYVDLVESLAAADRADRALLHAGDRGLAGSLRRPRAVPPPVPADEVEFEVASIVSAVAEKRSACGQEVWVRGGTGRAVGRPGDLWVALDRLLENAQQHAPSSPVTVHVLAIGSRVEVTVADRGPGLSGAVAERVLGDGPAGLPGRPSGIGLREARDLMRGNGGDLTLRGRIGGATFVLSLPAADQPAETDLSPCAS